MRSAGAPAEDSEYVGSSDGGDFASTSDMVAVMWK